MLMRSLSSLLMALALLAPTANVAAQCAASGASCGNINGFGCCASGNYCQPWDNAFYQCIAPPSGCGAMETDTDYAGTDVASFFGLKLPTDCCNKCKENAQCEYFVFINQWGPACYLKKGKGAKMTVKGAVVGTKATVTTPTPTTVTPTPSSCPTLQANTDYAGNDYKNVAAADIAACCTACNSDPACVVFAYASKVCYLKNKVGAASTVANVVSGIKTTATPTPTTPTPTTPTPTTPTPTTPTPSTCPTLEAGIDYFGNDLSNVGPVDQAGCCRACSTTSGCKVFTYVPATSTCYLKTSTAGRKSATGVVSGVIPTQSACPTLEVNVDYLGSDVATVNNVNQDQCCQACGSNTACKAFTYSPSARACYLKSSDKGRVGASGLVSGVVTPTTPTTPPPTTPTPTTPTPTTPKPTTPVPATCPASIEVDVDYNGSDLSSVATVDLGGCCSACNSNANCKTFTYFGGVCYLKTGTGARKAVVGAISGAKLSVVCANTEINVDYNGGDLSSLANVDQAACCDACTTDAKCLAFTYVSASRVCYLKGAGYTKKAGSGLVSGAKPSANSNCVAVGGACGGSATCCGAPAANYCHPWSSSDYQCLAKPDTCAAGLETDVDYFGNDVATIPNIDNLADCCDQCNRDARCVVFTFSKQYNSCYLKASDAGRTTVVGNVSGKRGPAPTPTTQPPTLPPVTPTPTTPRPPTGDWDTTRCGTQKIHIFYHGNDIRGAEKTVATVGECCDYCRATATCKAFSYFQRDNQKRCLLKTGATLEKTNYANALDAYVASGVFA